MAGKSVPKAVKAKRATSTTKAKPWDPTSEKQWSDDKATGGAAWAQRFIDGTRADPETYALEGWIADAERLFEGKRDELRAFYATIQRAILAENDSTRKIQTDQLTEILYDIGTLILAIRNLAHKQICGYDESGAIDVSVASLAEKAGYLSDKCINLLGDPTGSVGDFDAWAKLGNKESTDEAQVTA